MDGTDLVVGRLGEGSISRGCVASALLDAEGTLIESQPEGMAFPAAVLSVIQAQVRSNPGSSLNMPIGPHYVADVRRLPDGRFLVNLLMRPLRGPIAGRYEPPSLRTAFIRIAPTVRTDWEKNAQPVEPLPEARPELPAQAQPELPPAEPPPVQPEQAPLPAEPLKTPMLVLTAEPYEAEFDLQPPATSLAAATDHGTPWPAPSHRVPRRREFDWQRVARAGLVVLVLAGLVAGWPLIRPIFEPSGAHPLQTSTPTGGATLTLVPAPPPAVVPILIPYDATLRQGDSGESVRLLQARLRQLGYFTYPDDTGYFGDATYGAVFSFQEARGLTRDGVADPATIAALNACDQTCAYRGGGA